MRYLAKIPKTCERKGVDRLVLESFMYRITEVAAAVHAQEMTFSVAQTGGSLVARNVTYEGVVLDLDTVGAFSREPEDHISQDYLEMSLSVAVLRRAVSNNHQNDLPARIRSAYLEKLEAFGAEAAWKSRIEQIIGSDEQIAGITRAF